MTEESNTPRDADALLGSSAHAHLDGDSSPSKAAAFERDLRADAVLERRVAALRGMETWLRVTRPRTPSLLAASVERAIEAERVSAAAVGSVAPAADPGRVLPMRPSLRSRFLTSRVWIPSGLAAAAAVAILLLGPLAPDRTPDAPGSSPQEMAALGADSDASPVLTDLGVDPQSDPVPVDDTVRYRFLFEAPEAGEVCLAGDFNLWKVCDTRLEPMGEGLWSVSMELPRGRHEYMFVVDGRWMTDPKAVVTIDDGFGNRNAVLNL